MSDPASTDGAASTAAGTQDQPRAPRTREPRDQGGNDRRGGDRPRAERPRRRDDDHDDYEDRRPYRGGSDARSASTAIALSGNGGGNGTAMNGLVWALLGVLLTLGIVWLIDRLAPETPVVQPPHLVNPQPQIVNPNPTPAVVVPVAELSPEAALALMGAPGSGFVSGRTTGRGPQVFSIQETNLPGIGRCYMVNVAEKRGISAPPGTAIPAPEYQMANPPSGLRWVATDKPDPNKPGCVYYVLAP